MIPSENYASPAFRQLSERILTSLCEKYQVSPRQLSRYRLWTALGIELPRPYKTYDSLGGDPRTLVAPIGEKLPTES